MSNAAGACDVGLVGLGVMGRNLALNIADHGYRIAVYNRSPESTREFVNAANHEGLRGFDDLQSFISAIKQPRIIIALVPAGPPVDHVCEALLEVGAQPDDIVVDCGNSLWTDTIRRERDYRGKLTFFGSGISGGELGARFGPSLMPGGDPKAWQRLKPIWEAIAAKVDPNTGREVQTSKRPGTLTCGTAQHNVQTSTRDSTPPQSGEGSFDVSTFRRFDVSLEPCAAYIGPDGAGHYVKMVHNGIEYADMQLICEAYHLMRESLGMSPREMSVVFAEWNEGDLESYLIEITADILQQNDPITGEPLVDVILDAAGQKGTGMWTAVNALETGAPAMTIAEAVFARAMSAIKEERIAAAAALRETSKSRGTLPGGTSNVETSKESVRSPLRGEDHFDFSTFRRFDVSSIAGALYCSKLCAYAQGFQLMAAAQKEYGWQLNFGEIAKIWRGGCIIRAAFLQKITEAYHRDPNLANLLLDPYFRERIESLQDSWRIVIAHAALLGIPVPAFSSALAYYDSYRSERLPANLLQAQRDYFGAHTYERIDQPRGRKFHIDWPHPDRPQVEQG